MIPVRLSAIARLFLLAACTSFMGVLVFAANCNAGPMRTAYVANFGSDTVSVLSLDTNSVTNTIPVGDQPRYVAFTPNGTRAYVTNSGSGNVSVIDTVQQTVIGTINVGDNPEQIVITKDGLRAYVANYTSRTISVLNLATNTLDHTIQPVPQSIDSPNSRPYTLALHPTREELWIGFGNSVDEFNVGVSIEARSLANDNLVLGTALQNGRLFAGSGLVFRPDGSEAIGSEGCGFCGRFHVISGEIVGGVISTLPPQDILYDNLGGARGVARNPVSGVFYLAKVGQNGGSNRVVEFGGAGRTLLTGDPREMAVSPDGEFLYLTQVDQGGANPGSVAVIDTATLSIVTTIPVGLHPQGIAILVPEPATMATLSMGLVALLCVVRRGRTPFQR